MLKKILITGATDGIGLAAARRLASLGHQVLLHGRNATNLAKVADGLSHDAKPGRIDTFQADLSELTEVDSMATAVTDRHQHLDALINNAGVFAVPTTATSIGVDVRFVVNTLAPYLLTQKLLPLLEASGRVINLSSAAQSPVDLRALAGEVQLDDGLAYAQSKLALTMWTNHLASTVGERGPAMIAVNPGSMLATKMVKQAYGVDGADIRLGADILQRAALADDFASASGKYFDNDAGRFSRPHPDALDTDKCKQVVDAIEAALDRRPSSNGRQGPTQRPGPSGPDRA